MRLVRTAGLDEVLSESPPDPKTRAVVDGNEPFELWAFGRADIGKIKAQLPLECPDGGKREPIEALFPVWRRCVDSTEAVKDSYIRQLRVLEAGRPFRHRPIIGRDFVIIDGRHRLFAAWEYAADDPGLEIELFWGRAIRP